MSTPEEHAKAALDQWARLSHLGATFCPPQDLLDVIAAEIALHETETQLKYDRTTNAICERLAGFKDGITDDA